MSKSTVKLKGVAHFSIPVSDVKRSVEFYRDVVGCTFINGNKRHAFMDAGGLCLLLCQAKAPINPPGSLDYVHHSFIVSAEQHRKIDEYLASHNVAVFEKEDRDGGTVNGPRTYFRDPDGTRLEFIDLTSYDPTPDAEPWQGAR